MIPCGEKVIAYLDKHHITQADLSTSQFVRLVEVICGDKVKVNKVRESVYEKCRGDNTRLR